MKKVSKEQNNTIELPKEYINKKGFYAIIISALSILSLIIICIISAAPFKDSAILCVIFTILMIPVILVSNRLRKDKLEDIENTKRFVNSMMDYTIAMILIGSIFGLIPGLIQIISLVLFIMTRRKIKQYIKEEKIKEE